MAIIVPMPQQQAPVVMMERPSAPSNCPQGLEYLTQLDQLLVKQKVELFEVFTGYEMANKYTIRNSVGQQVYHAKEESGHCARQCCGPRRPFTMHVYDNKDEEIIEIEKPFKCMCYGQCFSCSKCCQDMIKVKSPITGETFGYVKQRYEGCQVMYSIQNDDKDTVLRIHGPGYCKCYCPGDDIPFELMSKDGDVNVGRISKQWGNLMRELFTDADNFGIQFPGDLDVRIKAVIIGAVFLIDFMFFETQGKGRGRH